MPIFPTRIRTSHRLNLGQSKCLVKEIRKVKATEIARIANACRCQLSRHPGELDSIAKRGQFSPAKFNYWLKPGSILRVQTIESN